MNYSLLPLHLTKICSSRTLPNNKCRTAPGLQERIHLMVTHDARQAEQTRHECFLCVLAQQPCAVAQLEGHIISAHEVKVGGEMTPFITITLGEEYSSFSLTRHYRSLVTGLMVLGSNLRGRKFTLRLYHLPPPITPSQHPHRTLYPHNPYYYTLANL